MRPAHGTIQRAAGFTLIELLIVIAISAILVALAVPSFQQAQARARASAWSSDLQSAFILAMSEAARYNRVAVVCRSATAAADAPACTDAAVAGFALLLLWGRYGIIGKFLSEEHQLMFTHIGGRYDMTIPFQNGACLRTRQIKFGKCGHEHEFSFQIVI